jgi:sRNA-binding protein
MRTAKQLIALLAPLFPNTFAVYQERLKPLKLKIYLDLAAALGEVEHLGAALGYYCRNIAYLKAQRVGAKRIDLDGNNAGVTAEQVENAQKAIAGLRTLEWKRRQARRGSDLSEAPTSSTIPRAPPRPSLHRSRRHAMA